MNITYITIAPTQPANSGARIRCHELAQNLGTSHSVRVLYFADNQQPDSPDIRYSAKNVQLPHSDPSKLNAYEKIGLHLRAILQRSFPAALFFSTKHNLALTKKYLIEEEPDVIILQSSFLLPLARKLRTYFPNTHFVLDAHNIEYILHERIARESIMESSLPAVLKLLKQLHANILSSNLRYIERSAGKAVDAIAAVSDIEARWWKKNTTCLKVGVVANAVDADYFKPQNAQDEKNAIYFCGTMSYDPNSEGVMWFYQHVWPTLSKALPNVHWYIIGKEPPEHIRNLASDTITITGTVDDVRTYIEKTAVSVVPLQVGGGTRLKILEALAMERPVVSTTLGAEGFTEMPGLTIADNAADMANEIIRLLNSPELASLGISARDNVLRSHTWMHSASALKELLMRTRS